MKLSYREALDRIIRATHDHLESVDQTYSDLRHPSSQSDRRLTVLAILRGIDERPDLTKTVWVPLLQELAAGRGLKNIESVLPRYGIPRWFRAWCGMVSYWAWHVDAPIAREPWLTESDFEDEKRR